MKRRGSFKFWLAVIFLSMITFVTPSHSGGPEPAKETRQQGKSELKKHRLTGIVTSIDETAPAIVVEGRRKTLTFPVEGEMIEDISVGERVRVFYFEGDGKKNVVTKIKKINNVKVSENNKKALRGK